MKNIELPGFMLLYLERMSKDDKKDSYIKRSRSDLRVFQKWIDGFTNGQTISIEWIHQLHKEDYLKFISWLDKKYSDASKNRICTVIAKLLEHLEVKNEFSFKDLVETPKSFPLKKKDFVSDQEYKSLLKSFKLSQNVPDLYKTAHKELSNRNVSMLYLMRFYGLTPAQISRISMKDINFTQNELRVDHDGHITTLKMLLKHKRQIYLYLQEVPRNRRPRNQSEDPLFVAYNNTSMSFQVDDDKQQPKRLAERSIMKLLQVEIRRAGIRQVSSTHLRNRAILDAIEAEVDDKKIMSIFGITYPNYLKRYKNFLSDIQK
ncbi:tyrosine-type recombinase/integrase [Rossellomorea arthrocnemi]